MQPATVFLIALSCLVLAAALLIFIRRERIPMNDTTRAKAPGRFLPLTHGKTHVMEDGPENGEVIVMIPGATLGLWIWKDLPKSMAAAGYRVIRYDLYGRGYSDRPQVKYDPALFDGQLGELLDKLNVKAPVTLFGLAFGCPIAATFATRHPEKVNRVCFFGPDGFGVVMTPAMRLTQYPVIGDLLVRLMGNAPLLSRLKGYTGDTKVLDWVRKNYEPDLQLKGFKRALLSSVRNMPIHDAEELYQKLDQAPAPLMVLWGDQDNVTPIPENFDARRAFPHSAVHIFPGIGHLPHVEAPGETARLLADFMNTAPAQRLSAVH